MRDSLVNVRPAPVPLAREPRDLPAPVAGRGRRKRSTFLPLLVGIAVAGLVALAPRAAHADEARVRFLADKLRNDGDFRVRTNAALALGATNDDGAVEPLCNGLSDSGRAGDSSEVVRQASAVALKRLNRPSSLPCLQARTERETNEGVKIAIARAVEAISAGGDSGGGGGGEEPIKENPNAKYYVALSSVVNATGRAQAEIERIVHHSMKQKLDQAGTHQLAPSNETADRAREVMKKRGMKGFYLSITVDRLDYSAGYLRVKVKVGVCNYPGKSLLGTLEKTLEDKNTASANKAAEDSLLENAAALASDLFSQNASAFL